MIIRSSHEAGNIVSLFECWLELGNNMYEPMRNDYHQHKRAFVDTVIL
jgi:hypothetical protein